MTTGREYIFGTALLPLGVSGENCGWIGETNLKVVPLLSTAETKDEGR